jgi:hypothetical protein
MVAIDHRFALGPPMRPSALSKKSFSNARRPIFACISLMSTSLILGASPPNADAARSTELRLPLNDGVWVNVEALSELGNGLIALNGRDRHLRLERR